MKEIKFRGKKLYNGKWIYGSLVGTEVISVGEPDVDEHQIELDEWCLVDPETVGQYTGLKDKKGKEIFEGDILKFGDFVWTVEWKNDRLGFGYLESADRMLECDGDHCEVIGNIHDKKDGETE